MIAAELIREEICSKCNTPLGRIIQVKGKVYFDDGIMLVEKGLKRCHCCGKVFYWNGGDMNLSKVRGQQVVQEAL